MADGTGFLTVSEDFYSIQGEGRCMGIPSIFLRLTGCNLTCKGWSYVTEAGEHLGCDSADVWRTGTKQSFEEILNRWQEKGWLTHFARDAHLIITGGEPLLQQNRLTPFLCFLGEQLNDSLPIYTEVETNGTIVPDEDFEEMIDHWNVSAKLSNNGDPRDRRYVQDALEWHAGNPMSFWKFVICNEHDLQEMFDEFIEPLNIPHSRIWLMPEGTKDEELKEKSAWIVELCKQHSFNFSHRLQVYIWEQVTGV